MVADRTGNFNRGVLAALFGALVSCATAVSPGDLETAVVEELGPPPNRLTIGDRQILDYERGRVEIENGVVRRVDLISEEAAAERRERQTLAEQVAAEVRAQHLRQGHELRMAKLNNPAFQVAPAAERAAFWRDFSLRYPTIPIQTEYRKALADLARQQEEIARRRRESAAAEHEAASLRADVLEARLRALEAEQKLLREPEPVESAPLIQNTVNVQIDVPCTETVFVPVESTVSRPPAPPAPTDPLLGRYSIERRLPPMGTPTFGGTPASSSTP